MSLYKTFYNIPEDAIPEPEIDIEDKPEIIICNYCKENVIDFSIYKGKVICSDCENNAEGLSLDEIVFDIEKYSK